ncbi:unnamed protein product [Periconia digitata]|uniref:Uncharacterized protein n=1 Tax=Periconia digitata TaxID=1303443 RepID=A0A9W4U461_9PLEO|nr:unnamed protein product [Periconia digitata]
MPHPRSRTTQRGGKGRYRRARVLLGKAGLSELAWVDWVLDEELRVGHYVEYYGIVCVWRS